MPTWLLAFLITYLHFFTAIVEKKKKPRKENILLKKELIVQKLSSEPKPATMKFTGECRREFVEYNFHEKRMLKKPARNILRESGIVMYYLLNRDLHVRVWTNYLV